MDRTCKWCHIIMLFNNHSWVQLFCKTTTWNFQKLLSYTFYVGNVVRIPVQLFSLPLQNFHVVPPTKKCLPCFFISRSKSVALFLVELHWPAAHFLFFSVFFFCSIFQICRLDTLSKLNTLKYTDTETISTFRFHLYWLFCCLCFTRHRWLRDFPPK